MNQEYSDLVNRFTYKKQKRAKRFLWFRIWCENTLALDMFIHG